MPKKQTKALATRKRKVIRPKRKMPLKIAAADLLPDNRDWTNRFHVRSASSNRKYVVSQHKKKRHWGCSCPGWIHHRNCKHLQALQLPAGEKPKEVAIKAS